MWRLSLYDIHNLIEARISRTKKQEEDVQRAKDKEEGIDEEPTVDYVRYVMGMAVD